MGNSKVDLGLEVVLVVIVDGFEVFAAEVVEVEVVELEIVLELLLVGLLPFELVLKPRALEVLSEPDVLTFSPVLDSKASDALTELFFLLELLELGLVPDSLGTARWALEM